MKCPNDGAILTMSERSGVEIDYCPDCRGVWLDRGELDKILDRVAADTPPAAGAAPPPQQPEQPRYDQRYDRGYEQPRYDQSRGGQQAYGDPRYRKKRKEHWLTELFD